MHLKHKKKIYIEQEQLLNIDQELENGVLLKASVFFEQNNFLDNQKSLIEDFVADLIDKLNSENDGLEDIKLDFEVLLQNLNTKLKGFADKFNNIDYFPIKGYIQIIADNLLMTSMIGDVTIIIFRENKLYYTLHNGINSQSNIDLFSDFVEGDVDVGDEIIYVGTKISDVIDQHDFKEIESILRSEEVSILVFVHEVITNRIDKKNIGFISQYTVSLNIKHSKSGFGINTDIITNNTIISKIKSLFVQNKYQSIVTLLSLIIFFMLYNLLTDITKQNSDIVYVTPQGIVIDITIDDIKKDIAMFQSLDPTSDDKSIKYQEILDKLNTLETKGKWLEDVAQLKKILTSNYYKGFNIITINTLSQFDDVNANKTTRVFDMNSSEISSIGNPTNIFFNKDIVIAGTKGALISTINNNVRGSLVDYGLSNGIVQGCSQSLLKDGIYCYTDDGQIFLVNKGGMQFVTTSDPDGFVSDIGGIGTFGKSNIYVLQKNVSSLADSALVTRYRNTLGSQSIFQDGQKYFINPAAFSGGIEFGSGFGSLSIDGSFLTWNNNKLYQFWRNPPTSFNLDYREIKLLGGDKMTSRYSDEVKIIAPVGSRYVYLFDMANQTFTTYDSKPLKSNDQYSSSYDLYYMFRFGFDLGSTKVIDVFVPDATGDKPEMYILTTNGVNKVHLYEFIDSLKQNSALKDVSN